MGTLGGNVLIMIKSLHCPTLKPLGNNLSPTFSKVFSMGSQSKGGETASTFPSDHAPSKNLKRLTYPTLFFPSLSHNCLGKSFPLERRGGVNTANQSGKGVGPSNSTKWSVLHSWRKHCYCLYTCSGLVIPA